MKRVKRNFTVITMLLFLISTNFAFSQDKSTPARVKSVTVYDEKYDKLVTKKYKESETSYDSRGNILEEIEYIDNKVDKHFKYEYDTSNNKIKEIEFNPSGTVNRTTVYKYDKGLRSERITYDPDGKLKSKKTYIYTLY